MWIDLTQLQNKLTVTSVQEHQIQDAIDFAMRVRREVFLMLDHTKFPVDFQQFREHYIVNEHTGFLVASMEGAGIVGTVGIVPYDGRIKAIEGQYADQSAAEVVKCYVDPVYRRYGIGSLLVKELENMAQDMRYTTLYLHTHRFLPGAVDFWKRQGYSIVAEEQDDVWQTVHMDKPKTLK